MLNNRMDTLAQRFKYAREKAGYTEAELGAKVGMTQQGINWIEIGRSLRPRRIKELAKILRVTPEWLLFGKEEHDLTKEGLLKSAHSVDNMTCPLVPWALLVEWGKNFYSHVNKGMGQMIVPKSFGEDVFTLTVETDSMQSSSTPSFNPGMILSCLPSIGAIHNDIVIARHKINFHCLFRQYINEGGKIYLKPLNPLYKMEEVQDYEIIAIVLTATLTLKSSVLIN